MKKLVKETIMHLINEIFKKNFVNIDDSEVGDYWRIRANPALTSKFLFEIAYNIYSSWARIRTILQSNDYQVILNF